MEALFLAIDQAPEAGMIVRETSLLIAECEAAMVGVNGRKTPDGLIVSAANHQLRRPALIRLLDLEEARLPFDKDTQRVIHRLSPI